MFFLKSWYYYYIYIYYFQAGGRIKPLWRGHGKGCPKGFGPYKVGLLVIERDAAGRLPFGWKRTDGK